MVDVSGSLHLARLRRELRSQRVQRLMNIQGNTIHPDQMAVPCSVVVPHIFLSQLRTAQNAARLR